VPKNIAMMTQRAPCSVG